MWTLPLSASKGMLDPIVPVSGALVQHPTWIPPLRHSEDYISRVEVLVCRVARGQDVVWFQYPSYPSHDPEWQARRQQLAKEQRPVDDVRPTVGMGEPFQFVARLEDARTWAQSTP